MRKTVDDAELVTLLNVELLQGDGWASSNLTTVRAQALAYYFGELPAPESEGRSAAVSTDVADMLEAVVAQILPGFSGDNVVEFEADSANDVEQAQLESDIVNDVVLEQNRGYVLFQEALRDSLLLRNGWVKCFVDEYTTMRQQSLPGELAEGMLAQVTAALEAQPGIDRVEVEVADDDGEPRAIVKVFSKRKRLCVESIDPCNVTFEADWSSVFLDGIRFIAERSYPTRSDLIEAGYSKRVVEELPAFAVQTTGSDLVARYVRSGGASSMPGLQPSNMPAEAQPIETYRCYYRYDSDGDGVVELHSILFAGGRAILEDEIVDFIPMATGTPFLQPHQLNGLGLFDKLRTVQDVKTATLRKWINNLEANNNARVALDERTVNMADAVNTRPGGIVRTKGPPANSIVPFPISDTGSSSAALLAYGDKMRSERGGAALDMQTAAAQVGANASGVAVDREYSVKEQLAAMMCRTLAETLIRSTYAMVHRALRTWFDEDVSARVRGEFVQSNPISWVERSRLNVRAGLSAGERAQREVALQQVLLQQEKMLAAGLAGQLTDLSKMYHAQLDWARSAGLDGAERYFTDPQSKGGQEAAQQAAKRAEEAAQQQKAIEDTIAASARQVEGMKAAIDKYQTDTKTSLDYFKAVLDAQVEMVKLGASGAGVEQLSAEGMLKSDESDDENVDDSEGAV